MQSSEPAEIVLISSGHQAMDSRMFDKEAVTLAKYFPRVRVVAAHPVSETREGVQITALPATRSRPARFLLRPLQCYWAARGAGDRIIIIEDAELLFWAPLVKLLTGWRVVYDVHEDFPQLLLRRTWIPALLRRSLGKLVGLAEKLYTHGCDGVMGATAVLADYFAPAPRVALYNLPSAEYVTSAARSARSLRERQYDVVHLGTLSDERLDFLQIIFTRLFAQTPDARALVIGVQPEQEARIRNRFPERQVLVIGKVGYDRTAGYLGNCRIGLDIHPILYPHLRCAVPVKVFEYMAAGCNVVTSHLPELHRLLGDEGAEHVMTIYTPSPQAFADELVRLLHEPASMLQHQAALMHLVRAQWNWGKEADKLVNFIAHLSPRKEIHAREQVLNH
jgi:glycosyltransferase involved in cell wall biosynthesis